MVAPRDILGQLEQQHGVRSSHVQQGLGMLRTPKRDAEQVRPWCRKRKHQRFICVPETLGGKRGQEVMVQPGLAVTALGRQWKGREGDAGVTSVEVLRGGACVQPTSAGQQSSELPAALAAWEFSNTKKKCSVLQGGGCSLLKCAGSSQPWCCGLCWLCLLSNLQNPRGPEVL